MPIETTHRNSKPTTTAKGEYWAVLTLVAVVACGSKGLRTTTDGGQDSAKQPVGAPDAALTTGREDAQADAAARESGGAGGAGGAAGASSGSGGTAGAPGTTTPTCDLSSMAASGSVNALYPSPQSGDCRPSCATAPAGQDCAMAGCLVRIADCQPMPSALAVDDTNIYWNNAGDGGPSGGTVMRAPLAGGSPEIAAAGVRSPRAMVVHGTRLYGATADGVLELPLDGRPPTTLASEQAYWLSVDAQYVYLAGLSGILKVPLGGGAPTTLTSVKAYWIVVDADYLYFATSTAVMKVHLDGGAPTTLASGVVVRSNLALDSTAVYWAEGGAIRKVPLQGGAVTTLASDLDQPESVVIGTTSIAVDALNAYWTNGGSTASQGSVMSVPLAGGKPVKAAICLSGGSTIVSHGNSLYWVDYRYPEL